VRCEKETAVQIERYVLYYDTLYEILL